jgi:hypothetical protein
MTAGLGPLDTGPPGEQHAAPEERQGHSSQTETPPDQ